MTAGTAAPETPARQPLAASLTPFSKMVFDHTSIPFRFPTPETPTLRPAEGPARSLSTPAPTKQEPSTDHKPIHLPTPAPAPPKQVPAQPKQEPSKSPTDRKPQALPKARLEILLPTKAQLEAAAAAAAASANESGVHGIANVPIKSGSPAPATLAPQPYGQAAHLIPPGPGHDVPQPSLSIPATGLPQALSASQKAAIAIEIPRAANFIKEEYLAVPDEPEPLEDMSMKRRKRDDLDGDDIYSLDMRQRADAALNDLRLFLHNAFQAEDYATNQRTSDEMVTMVGDNEVTLTAAAQAKAQTLLAKTISLNCYKRVPLDHLLRLFRLSEAALKQIDSLDIKIDESWGAPDFDQWLQQLPPLEMAMRAARTCLRMMCGEREEKQLYPEDVIEHCLNLCKRLIDGVVIPIVELRSTQHTAELFRAVASSKKKMGSLFTDCQKLLSLMSTLISKVDTSDTVTNTLEFAASRLIFMETVSAEKDSVMDTQKFDGLRLVAMDMLSHIFVLNPAQRQGIFDEILTSLEKLPLGRRARTFKLVDGSSIQPVSALIMRLIQTSAGKVDGRRSKNKTSAIVNDEETNGDGQQTNQESFMIQDEEHAAVQHSTAIQELDSLAPPLLETSKANATYVVKFIVNRALKSTKSGDAPYRNLLDLFVEDFTTCLDNPDWPAAELLLRLLMVMMVNLVENDKSGVPAKNMALELLGTMGAAISKLRGHVRKVAGAIDSADELGTFLSELAASALELKARPEHMVSWTGPYRATVEYLESRFSQDPHLASAISFIVSDWGAKTCVCYDSFEDDSRERDQELGRLAYRLREMIRDRRWLSSEYSFKDVSQTQARLSYSIILLKSQLCEAFSGILNILLNSMASDQPTVRSKSLKSINQVLETDPSILDGDSVVVQLILRCSNDSSTQVRDSALGLIGKCISMRPALEEKMTETVIDRFADAGPGVRKRAMKLAKDIYLRNNNRALRSAIANGLLHRVQDPEESVRDLARQVIEEIWFAPFHGLENSAAGQISLSEHVSLMVSTVKRGGVANVLDKVLQSLLAPGSKSAEASKEVCAKLVASMFDLVTIGDSGGDPSVPTGRDALQVLMIFAKAEARLFTFEQLRLLKSHITGISSSDDLAVSRAVVVIYRRVLPQLSSAQAHFLADVRKELMPVVSKVTRALLDDVMACLWIISTLLETSEHLARLVLSSLTGIQKLRALSQREPLDQLKVRQFDRYSLIVGMAGKHCNLDSHLEMFKKAFPKWNGETVSKLMVDVVVPFAAPSQPLDIRKAALDSVGLVCQASPRNYVAANVYTTFQQVFDDQIPALETMILRSLKEFLFTEEKRSEGTSEAPAINGAKSEKKRELTVIGGTNYDDVASATTHRFLREITRIATSTQDEHAFLAVEVLASINRQGLVHPKETGVTFITLETSTHPRISELAFLEHKALHTKHETVVEREYVKAIQSAFAYQRDIVKDPRGATPNPFTPKMHLLMEVLKISKSKNRQKFLEKFCAQVDFDMSKLDISETIPSHVQYSRFIIENLAFFEYITVGEVHCIVSAIEKLVTSTGANVAQAIESEVFQLRVDVLDEPTPSQQLFAEGQGQGQPPQPGQSGPDASQPPAPEPAVDFTRLRQLTAGSMILLALWEVRTYLRRLYGLGTTRRGGTEPGSKVKLQSKDLAKPPVKVQGITGDKVWDEIGKIMESLADRGRMMATCRAFIELMNVDKEFLVLNDEDDENVDMGVDEEEEFGEDGYPGSGAEDGDFDGGALQNTPSSTGRGRKRKAQHGAGGAAGGPKKKQARSGSQPPRQRGRPRKSSVERRAQEQGHAHASGYGQVQPGLLGGSQNVGGAFDEDWF
ncbi:hypothetical protein VTJ49DRAFT_307 [Mycothermus thermophilus]|uniref:Sister chromatid cohesion protein n=1 Tax=Humicola insolens TaxID=85995 RepID=A0ABR3VFH5_HUMIN